ncbi:hypothetical protein EDD86DRAFT_203857, partial [Gorgonomyces haynaldii]
MSYSFSPQVTTRIEIPTYTEAFVLSDAVLSIKTSNNWSPWDVVYTDWPSIKGQGIWEWYCPDDECGGQGWMSFGQLPTQVPHAWIAMGAVRWRPLYLPAGTSTYIIHGTLDKQAAGTNQNLGFTKTLVLSTDDSFSEPLVVEDPYTTSFVCTDHLTLTASGVGPLSLPFGPFDPNSPLRPLCVGKTMSAYETARLGDFSLLARTSLTVQLSGWYDLSDRAFAKGFTPVTFVGHDSRFGSVVSTVAVATSGRFQLLTPQVRVNHTKNIKTNRDMAVFRVDTDTSAVGFQSVSEWDPLSLKMTLDIFKSGIYVFGTLDPTNDVLPVFLGDTVTYFGQWGNKTFAFGSLLVTISGSKDFVFVVSTGKATNSLIVTISQSFNFGFDSLDGITITATFKRDPGTVWAFFKQMMNNEGGKWTSIPDGNQDTIRITQTGEYGVINAQGVAAASDAKAIGLSIFIWLLLLL